MLKPNPHFQLRTPCKSHELHLRRKEAMIEANHNAKTTMVPTSSTRSTSSFSSSASTSPRSSFSSVIGTTAAAVKQRRKRQVLQHKEPLFENLKDSSHMKDGSPILHPKDDDIGWSIKGLGGRPKAAKQVRPFD